MTRSFAVFEIQLTNARSALKRPFRIMETFMTLDGTRTRVASGNWETSDEAMKFLGERLDKEGLEFEFFSSYD